MLTSGRRSVFFRAIAIWLLIIAVETVHGILRTFFLVPMIGDFPARRLSVITASFLIFAVTYFSFRYIRANSTKQLVAIGFLWVVLTVLFEIALGRFVLDLPWDRLVEDYDLSRGGVMGLGLLFMAITPIWVAQLRKNSSIA